MFRPRVIPVLLLQNKGLVKSIRFKNHRYIGDPINAVKIFNDLKADELVFLDINATKEKRSVSLDFVKKVGQEANMPFSVGGGIKKINEIREILSLGAEKVVINSHAGVNPEFIKHSSEFFGSSTLTVCLDVKETWLGKECIWVSNGQKNLRYNVVEYAQLMEEMGAGELIIQSINRDGTMLGYDIGLIKRISEAVRIPVVALGGAGVFSHLKEAREIGMASAMAAGSMFVYHGPRKGILINYPSSEDLIGLLSN